MGTAATLPFGRGKINKFKGTVLLLDVHFTNLFFLLSAR